MFGSGPGPAQIRQRGTTLKHSRVDSMAALLTDEEKQRWQLAREILGNALERLSKEMARERAAEGPDRTCLAHLDAQWRSIADRRYGLSMHDPDEVARILADPALRLANMGCAGALTSCAGNLGAHQSAGCGRACCGRI